MGKGKLGCWCLLTSKANNKKATVSQLAQRQRVFCGHERDKSTWGYIVFTEESSAAAHTFGFLSQSKKFSRPFLTEHVDTKKTVIQQIRYPFVQVQFQFLTFHLTTLMHTLVAASSDNLARSHTLPGIHMMLCCPCAVLQEV